MKITSMRVDITAFISGLSKTWTATGLRIGILVAGKEVIDKIEVLATNIYSCPLTPFQHAALKAFEIGIDWFDKVRED